MEVLVVDDDPDFAESLAMALEIRDCTVTIAASGEEALEIYRDHDFQLAFMDVQLPGMSGVESYLAIHQSRPDVRMVLITGYSDPEDLEKAQNNGVLAILRKPLDMESVFDIMEKCRTGER